MLTWGIWSSWWSVLIGFSLFVVRRWDQLGDLSGLEATAPLDGRFLLFVLEKGGDIIQILQSIFWNVRKLTIFAMFAKIANGAVAKA